MSKGAYLAKVGADIKSQRQALGVSQLTVAKAIGVTAGSIRNWEQGTAVLNAYSLALLRSYFKKMRAASETAAGLSKANSSMEASR
ncbi:MAG TPA: helix-turn-helix domain-containing protein [Acidobacteriaceae bacterium]